MSLKHRVLIIGVGSIGERHLRCFAATGRADVSLCEINPALRQTVAERYSVTDIYNSVETALATSPDVVVVATPAHLHIPIATTAAQDGAHLLIEKPLSTTFQGIDELESIILERDLTASIAYVYRSHPVLGAMRDALHSGRFGEPVQIVITTGQHFPFYRPAYRDTYYKDRHTGGGAVQDALTHLVNAAEWLVGPVDRIVADVDHKVLAGVDVEDTVHVLTRHGSIMGCYSLNQHQAPNELTVTIVCTRGTVRFENHFNRWRWIIEPGSEWLNEEFPTLERDTLFTRQANSFLDAVEKQAAPACNIAAAKQTLKVNLAILSSAEHQRWEQIPKERS
jgi:predicted dehydrogenase